MSSDSILTAGHSALVAKVERQCGAYTVMSIPSNLGRNHSHPAVTLFQYQAQVCSLVRYQGVKVHDRVLGRRRGNGGDGQDECGNNEQYVLKQHGFNDETD